MNSKYTKDEALAWSIKPQKVGVAFSTLLFEEISSPSEEDELACIHCKRLLFAGSTCCLNAAIDLWQAADSEVKFLRKIRSKNEKEIARLRNEISILNKSINE